MKRLSAWTRDLTLGIQLALRGARMRTALTAIGIGLSVGVLLFAAALPTAIQAHDERANNRSIINDTSAWIPATASTTLAANVRSTWKGTGIAGVLIQADGPTPPKPPGVQRVPRAGEIVVSPALDRMLREPGSELLQQRLGGHLIGTIGDVGLSGPAEPFFYAGSAALANTESHTGAVTRVSRFGSSDPPYPLDPFFKLLVLIGSVVLLFPIAILVATAARFGSARRDRRLAALRLLGTSRRETTRIAAGESLAAGLVGVGLGTAIFVGARAVVENVEAFGFSLFAADVRPDPQLSALVIVATLVVTVASTLLSMRRVSVEPLSVVRRGRGAKRRIWWRPIPTLAGVAVLAPLLGQSPDQLIDAQLQIAAGAVLILVGIVALLPWVVAATVRRLQGWSVPSQLAIRNLQLEAAVAARIVSGISVAIAGAIALQMLLTVPERDARIGNELGAARSTATAAAYTSGTHEDVARLRATLATTPGVTRVSVITRQELRGHSRGQGDGSLPSLIVGDCAALLDLAEVAACDDRAGTVVRAVSPVGAASADPSLRGVTQEVPVPVAGERVKAHAWWEQDWAKFTLPSDVQTVEAHTSIDGRINSGILATPNAVPLPAGGSTDIEASVWLDPSDTLALDRLQTTVASVSPLANVYDTNAASDASDIATAKRLLLAGSTLLLMLIAASLIVTTLEQLGERRRSLATLAAFGTPRPVLRRALWWQTAIPVSIGLALAVGIGTGLGGLLLALEGEPVQLDVAGTAGLVAIGASLIVVVTAAALPLLRAVASPQAMRTE